MNVSSAVTQTVSGSSGKTSSDVQVALLRKTLDQEANQMAQLMAGIQAAPASDPSGVKGSGVDIVV